MIRVFVFVMAFWAAPALAQDTLRLAVTTSFHNSGLADVLVPEIRADLDLKIQLLVVGTGQALKLGRAGDVDAILVHSRAAEEAFVAEGAAPYRLDIMYNDFVIVGPAKDPAGISQATRATQALSRIQRAQAPFVSRGDDSGTHLAEQALWTSPPSGRWYKSVGAGMGAALNTAAGLNAYILTDRASWLNFGNRGGLDIVFEGDPDLFNPYGYLPVSNARHPHARADLAERLGDWLTSPKGKSLIDGYLIGGAPVFFSCPDVDGVC